MSHTTSIEALVAADMRKALRRVMCNKLDQQICQVAQRSTEVVVDTLSTSVCRNLGRQTRQQPGQGLRSPPQSTVPEG